MEAALRRMLTTRLGASYELEVIDVLRRAAEAEAAGILATPTLLREHPAPAVRIVGDLTDEAALFEALGVARDG